MYLRNCHVQGSERKFSFEDKFLGWVEFYNPVYVEEVTLNLGFDLPVG